MMRRLLSPPTLLLLLLAAGCQGPAEPMSPAAPPPPEQPPGQEVPAEPPLEAPPPVPAEHTSTEADAPPPEAAAPAPAEDPAPEREAPAPAPPADDGLLTSFEGARPALVSMPVPVFPRGIDFEAVIPGWVDFSVHLDAQGRVTAVELLEASHPALVEPAREALEEARFEPVLAPIGMPVPVEFRHRVEF